MSVLVKPPEATTVTTEQLVAMFSIKFDAIWVIAKLCTVCQTKVTTKTKQSEFFLNFVVVAIVSVIVLGHPFDKRVVF